jgi:flagellar hook-associated protein 2
VDSGTLSTAMQNNYSGVQNFFQGASLSGFAGSLHTQLLNFTEPADGAFTVDLQSMSTEFTADQTDIANFQVNIIAPLKVQMQAEFSSAEIALQQLPGKLKDVDAELGLNNNSNN